MHRLLRSLGATLVVALVAAAATAPAGAAHSGSKGCATKAGCAGSGLRIAAGGVGFESGGRYDLGILITDAESIGAGPSSTSDAPEFGLDMTAQTAARRAGEGAAETEEVLGWPDAGDHVRFAFPTAMSSAPAGFEDELVWGAIWI
jgi:hypothetical protein